MTRIGFVVVEWNQASHWPSIAQSDLHQTVSEAEEQLRYEQEETAKCGRAERHTIAEVVELDS